MPQPLEPPEEAPPGSAPGPGELPGLDALLIANLAYVRAFLRLRLGQQFRARESVSDLVQSVCRDILEHSERFRYQGDKAFRAWLCNAALSKLRDKRRYHLAAKRDLGREIDADGSRVAEIVTTSFQGPATRAMHAEEQQRIERAFDQLAENQREVLTLFHIVGLSHREIAERLGISAGNSRTILTRALAAFAARWEEMREHD